MTANPKRSAAYLRGLHAEERAAEHLRGQGYTVLKARHKTPHGEIDVIAEHGGAIIFIEVKARPTHADGLACISPRQRTRIIMAANHYVSEQPPSNHDMRFDVITVTPDGSISHLPNAWDVDVMALGI